MTLVHKSLKDWQVEIWPIRSSLHLIHYFIPKSVNWKLQHFSGIFENSAKNFLIWFHLLFGFRWLDSSTVLDFSSLFHLINPKVPKCFACIWLNSSRVQLSFGCLIYRFSLRFFLYPWHLSQCGWRANLNAKSERACFQGRKCPTSRLPTWLTRAQIPVSSLTQPVQRDFDRCFVLDKAEGCMLANCSRPRMPVESRGGLLADALVWPALNRYPTAKQQDAGRQRTGKVTRCTGAACNQPDPFWPFAPPFIRPCQVGGTLFIYLFI